MDGRRRSVADRYLDRVARGLLDHDDRLRGIGVEVRFDGGVAHLTGGATDRGELDRVREAIGQLAGVHAVWDRVSVAGRAPVMIDLGCGDTRQYADAVGVDRRPGQGVHVIADVSLPLPLRTGGADAVFAVHVLEHLIDWLPTVAEVRRCLRPGGVLHVMSPHWGHPNAVADPTHVRYFDTQTFKYLCAMDPPWYPLHIGCDGASVFADLTPVSPRRPAADEERMARFFD